jgi:hypothetical protein
MKRKCLLVLLGLLALALAAAPALAANVSLTGTNDFSVSFFSTSAGPTLDLSAFAQGYAVGSNYDFPVPAGPNPGVIGSPATAALTPGFYLTNTQGTTQASTPASGVSPVTMTQNLAAIAPDQFGYTFQQVTNGAIFTATAGAAGFFIAAVGDAYHQLFSLTNTGSDCFSSLYTYTNLTATLTDTTTGGGNFVQSTYNLLTYEQDNAGHPLGSFSSDITQSLPFAMLLTGVAAGDILTLELSLDTTQTGGATPVPLPPSVLLLGSSLTGLFLVRRWKRQPDQG